MFDINDRVFHIQHGWGTVKEIIKEDLLIDFDKFDGGPNYYFNYLQIELLSHTEYTLDGFTQEKPKPSWVNIWDEFLESDLGSVLQFLDENFEPPVRKCK
jgi:hypothetical protein